MDLYYQTIIPKVSNEPVFLKQSGITNDYVIQSVTNQYDLIPFEKWVIERYLKEELGFHHNEINFNSGLIVLLTDYNRYYEYHRHHDQ